MATESKLNTKTGTTEYVPGNPITGRRTVISAPGSYCLEENLWVNGFSQRWRWDGPTFSSDDTVVIEISSSDVSIDLQGHAVGSDARLSAAIDTQGELRSNAAGNSATKTLIYENIAIKNGSINPKRGNRALLIANIEPLENVFSDFSESFAVRSADGKEAADDYERERRLWARNFAPKFLTSASLYPRRNLHLENLKVRSSMPSVVLQGANSVIRNNVIETDSGTALQIHGPGAVVENNTIIIHCVKSQPTDLNRSTCLTADAPIRLIHGDGAIIRNNRFIIKGGGQRRVLSLFETGPFTFEGNTIIGVDDLSQIAKVFTGSLQMSARNNEIK